MISNKQCRQEDRTQEELFKAFLNYEIASESLTKNINSYHAIAIFDIALSLWKSAKIEEINLKRFIRFFMMNPKRNYSMFKENREEYTIMIGGLQ